MDNLETVRELRKILDATQKIIDDLTPKPDITKTDYEPQFELGTRFCNSLGNIFRYVKIDAGVVGIDSDTNKELKNTYYRWLPRDMVVYLPVGISVEED